jgi:hypothetical protein
MQALGRRKYLMILKLGRGALKKFLLTPELIGGGVQGTGNSTF